LTFPLIDLFSDLFEFALHVSGEKLPRLQEQILTFPLTDLFIDLFEFALHVSGDKIAHLQEHFSTVYTALVQCTDIAAGR
jgi:hypothetical protein